MVDCVVNVGYSCKTTGNKSQWLMVDSLNECKVLGRTSRQEGVKE